MEVSCSAVGLAKDRSSASQTVSLVRYPAVACSFTVAKMMDLMHKPRTAVLLVAGLLLLCQLSLASSHHCSPAASRESVWSCIHGSRINRLEPLLLSLIHDPSNLAGSTVQGYVQHRLRSSAEDLLLYASLHTDSQTDTFVDYRLDEEQLYVSDTAASAKQPKLPQPSRLRQLLQLASTFTDIARHGNQLTRTSISKARVSDPEASYQLVSNSYESSSMPFSQEAVRFMATVTPGLMHASSKLFGDDLTITDEGNDALSDTAASISDSVRGSRLNGVKVPVAAMAGQQQQQQQMEPLQPSLRIVGGVEAPTDRWDLWLVPLRVRCWEEHTISWQGCALCTSQTAVCLAQSDVTMCCCCCCCHSSTSKGSTCAPCAQPQPTPATSSTVAAAWLRPVW